MANVTAALAAQSSNSGGGITSAGGRSLLTSHLTTSFTSNSLTNGHMFDIKAKSPININGININTILQPDDKDGVSPVEIWTKVDTYKGSEQQESRWTLLFEKLATTNNGPDQPTTVNFPPIYQRAVDGKRSFYIHCKNNIKCLRYDSNAQTTMRYQDDYLILFGDGQTKLGTDGWSSAMHPIPHVFSGGVLYEAVTPSPTKYPTLRPTTSPTTAEPSKSPTSAPSQSPVITETISTQFESTNSYAGTMFNVQSRQYNVYITSMAFNTDKYNTNVNIKLYMRDGSYVNHDKELTGWELVVSTVVKGNGLDKPTYIQFDTPIEMSARTTKSFYLTSDGPHIRVSKGVGTGDNEWGVATASDPPERATFNSALIITEGLGKQLPEFGVSTFAPRVWNGLFEYHTTTVAPTRQPTAYPTLSPTTAMPTKTDFRLRLYWQRGYSWQDVWYEMWYCMACGRSGRPCQPGDPVYVERCGSSNRQKWNQVGDTLRPLTNPNLCMTTTGYNAERPNRLYECKNGYKRQQFDGFDHAKPFELYPRDDNVNCMSQQHHPRSGEGVYPENCALSRRYQTNAWTLY